MVVEFEADLIKMRTREGMKVAKAKGRLRAKQPKLKPNQAKHLLDLHDSGNYTQTELAELFGVGRSTIYRTIDIMRPQPVEPERPFGHPVPPSPNTRISTLRGNLVQPSNANSESEVADSWLRLEMRPVRRIQGRSPNLQSGLLLIVRFSKGRRFMSRFPAKGSAMASEAERSAAVMGASQPICTLHRAV